MAKSSLGIKAIYKMHHKDTGFYSHGQNTGNTKNNRHEDFYHDADVSVNCSVCSRYVHNVNYKYHININICSANNHNKNSIYNLNKMKVSDRCINEGETLWSGLLPNAETE